MSEGEGDEGGTRWKEPVCRSGINQKVDKGSIKCPSGTVCPLVEHPLDHNLHFHTRYLKYSNGIWQFAVLFQTPQMTSYSNLATFPLEPQLSQTFHAHKSSKLI